MKIISLDQHALLQQWFRLMRKVETLPAHPDQTALITKLGAWGDELKAMLDKHALLRVAPAPTERVRVLKATLNGQTLILEEYELDMLWEYVEDWSYGGIDISGMTLEFTTMPHDEVADLPEFDGF